MSADERRIGDQLFLSLEAVAAVFEIEDVWLKSVQVAGLLGDVHVEQRRVWIAAARLERVGTLVRLCHGFGLDLSAAREALGD